MRQLVCALVLALPALTHAAPRCVGGSDGFRVGQSFDRAVLSPDGRFFAVSGERGGFYVLAADTGQVVHAWDDSPLVGDLLFDAASRLLVLDRAGWVRTYDPVHGRCLREVLLTNPMPGLPGGLPRSTFLPGGHFVEIGWRGGCDRPSALHDTTTGQPVAWVGDMDSNDHVTCSPDGSRLAVIRGRASLFPVLAGDPRGLHILDLKAGKKIAQRLPERDEEIADPVFRPDGRALLVIAGPRPTLLDLATGQSRLLKLEDWTGGFDDPVWSPDGRRIAMIRHNRELGSCIREWDVATGRLLRTEQGALRGPDSIGYSPEGRLLAWNSSGARLAVHTVGRPRPPVPTGHLADLCDLMFSGDSLLSLDTAGVVCRWDLPTGALLERVELPKELSRNRLLESRGSVLLTSESHYARFDPGQSSVGPVKKLPAPPDAISPDGHWFLDWATKRGRLFDPERGRTIWLPPKETLWPQGRHRTPEAVWSPDGRWLALSRICGMTGHHVPVLDVAIVKLPSARLVRHLTIDTLRGGLNLSFTSDGTHLLIANSSVLNVYETATGGLRRQYQPAGSDGEVYPLACSPDSRLLFVALERGEGSRHLELQLIELATGTVRRTYPRSPGMTCRRTTCFSPDGRWIACPRTDSTVLLLPTDSTPVTPTGPEAIWRDLASPDAAVAGAAVLAAAQRPDAEVWLRAHLTQPTRAVEPELSAQVWLAELDSDDPDRREAARNKLARRPDLLPALEAALPDTASPELRRALAELRDEPDQPSPLTPDALRRLRLAEALDRVAKP